MIKQPRKSPKLRSKGAETRGLVPFGFECAMEMYDKKPTDHTQAVLQCISSLMDYYVFMNLEAWDFEVASGVCRKFCILYGALANEARVDGQDLTWKITPKMHMFQEMVEYQSRTQGNPKLVWTYPDEDFVGWIAEIAGTRGGPHGPSTVATGLLNRYRALSIVRD
eukprot:121207-Lingulodinium_polyedra.AAC.1